MTLLEGEPVCGQPVLFLLIGYFIQTSLKRLFASISFKGYPEKVLVFSGIFRIMGATLRSGPLTASRFQVLIYCQCLVKLGNPLSASLAWRHFLAASSLSSCTPLANSSSDRIVLGTPAKNRFQEALSSSSYSRNLKSMRKKSSRVNRGAYHFAQPDRCQDFV